MAKWAWLKRIAVILILVCMLACFLPLLGRTLLGDLLHWRIIEKGKYITLAILLFLFSSALLLLMRKGIAKINVRWLVVAALILIVFSFFQFNYYPLRVEGDGVGYFAYLRSLYFDRDLNFLNEYRELHAVRYGVHGWIDQWGNERYPWVPATYMQANSFSIGPALLWYPFYHAADLLYRGSNPQRTGYEPIYLNLIRFGHIVYGLLAFILLYFTLTRFFKPLHSFLAILVILFMSPLYYYLSNSTFYSHILSFFAVCLFLYIFAAMRDKANPLYWALLGLAAGLATLVRWQNATNILLPIAYLFFDIFKDKVILRRHFLVSLLKMSLFLLFFIIGTIPQLLAFKTIYGTALIVPQGNSFITAFPAWIGQTLFSPFHGLFHWHPLLIIGIIGFFLKFKGTRQAKMDGAFYYTNALGFSIQTYVNSSLPQFWAGAAFGARRFVDSFGFLAFGIANLIRVVSTRRILRIILLPLPCFFYLFNIFMEKALSWNFFPAEASVPLPALLRGSWKSFAWAWRYEPRTLLFVLSCGLALTLFSILLLRRDRDAAAAVPSLRASS